METVQETAKRPIGVWVLTCVYALILFINIPMFVYAINNHPGIFSQVSEQFTTLEIILSLASVVLVFVAMIFLFFLRSLSFWILLSVTLISLIPLGIRLLSGQEIPLPEGQGYGYKFIELIIWGSILIYIWKLKSQGVLK